MSFRSFTSLMLIPLNIILLQYWYSSKSECHIKNSTKETKILQWKSIKEFRPNWTQTIWYILKRLYSAYIQYIQYILGFFFRISTASYTCKWSCKLQARFLGKKKKKWMSIKLRDRSGCQPATWIIIVCSV